MKALMVAKRLIKQLRGDKRTLGLIFIAPIFVMFVLFTVINSSASKPNLGLVEVEDSLTTRLASDCNITVLKSAEEAIPLIKSKKLDAVLDMSDMKPKITIDGADPSITMLVSRIVQKNILENVSDSKNPLIKLLAKNPKPELTFLYGSENTNAFDYLAPVMMGFMIFFFVFLLSGISFLRERTTGTLERICATPLRRSDIVLGYLLGFGAFATIQTILIQWFMIYVLNIPVLGNFWEILVLNLSLAAVALTMGTFFSSFANNEFQMMQFIPIVIVPQILFSGIIDLRDAPQWVVVLSKAFPLTYGGQALREVMIRGEVLSTELLNISIMLGFAAFFVILNIQMLKKYRKV